MSTGSDDTIEPPIDTLLAGVARIPLEEVGWQPPEELDEYKLVRPLGRGGMGSVWLARDQLLDRLVAVKFIAHAESDATTLQRFAIEARAAARLQHENVVTVYRYGQLAGRPYLVAEYIRGEPLDKLAKPIAWDRVLDLGVSLARGLAAAHRAGIVHRDIKPGNAILTADGGVKLVDFGLAKLGNDDVRAEDAVSPDGSLTAPGAIAGTPRYLAPEVRLGATATPRADVYGIGCILYELITGRAPLFDARDGIVPALTEPENARLAAVIERCLREDPDERYANGDELREALEKLTAAVAGGELPEGNPYRGLAAYEEADRRVFFGRGPEIRGVLNRLRGEAMVVVTGDSGVGKSSLCRAGVLGHIRDGAFGDGRTWSVVEVIPGPQPLAAVASAFAAHLEQDEANLARGLRDDPEALARALRHDLGSKRGVVVFVDQLEELLTLAGREDAVATSAVLGHLAMRAPGIRILATARSDFLTRLAELIPLGDFSRVLYVLPPLTAEGAREAIVGPATTKGARFESGSLVDRLVASLSDPDRIELPLLAFTLAQLWDARDPTTQMITERSLDAIGGVRGALARHADGVLAALLPAQRAAARTLLLRLVTPERTKARRAQGELGADGGALDALVRARLVIARGGEHPTYELAHERLIDGWPTLVGWLSQTVEAHATQARLAAAAAEWERLGHAAEALWGERQLSALAVINDAELTARERAFVVASRRRVRRRRFARRAAVTAIPLAIASVLVGARVVARRDREHRVDASVVEAERVLTEARATAADAEARKRKALDRFDAGDDEHAEPLWLEAEGRSETAGARYADAARALEAAFLLDTARDDVRARLAAITKERIALATTANERADLAARLTLYDPAALRDDAVRIAVTTEPADARVALMTDHGETPLPRELAPGSYVLIARRDGRGDTRVPFVVSAGGARTLHVVLPAPAPPGMMFVPAGRFLYGSADGDPIRRFLTTVPAHELSAGPFLIGRTEVTFRQWIEYLDALSPEEREQRRPHIVNAKTVGEAGGVDLRRTSEGWQLHMTPDSTPYVGEPGKPFQYQGRTRRASQDWLDFPVVGIAPPDAEAYAAWLDHTGRLPGARLCSEVEWEYAARGVDGRPYPAGDHIAPDDVNIDVTYGRVSEAFGPDAVGSHPASTSPFGLADTCGNVWEITRARDGGYVTRGGSFYHDASSASLANRQVIPKNYRHVVVGLRLCADPR